MINQPTLLLGSVTSVSECTTLSLSNTLATWAIRLLTILISLGNSYFNPPSD